MSSQEMLGMVTQKYEDAYRKRTPKSWATNQMARRYMPGGDTRTGIFFWPYPIWIDQACGCRFTDLDGNEYLDFHNCYATLVPGHANPKVIEAVREQISKGTTHGTLMPITIRWAELICHRVESVGKIRFANSGTEAVMMTIRAARALPRKGEIIKCLDRKSKIVSPGKVVRVVNPKAYDRTPVVSVAVAKEFAQAIRAIYIRFTAIIQPNSGKAVFARHMLSR